MDLSRGFKWIKPLHLHQREVAQLGSARQMRQANVGKRRKLLYRTLKIKARSLPALNSHSRGFYFGLKSKRIASGLTPRCDAHQGIIVQNTSGEGESRTRTTCPQHQTYREARSTSLPDCHSITPSNFFHQWVYFFPVNHGLRDLRSGRKSGVWREERG